MNLTSQLPLLDDSAAKEKTDKDKHPGLTLELDRLAALYNQLVSVLADAKLSKSLDDLQALERHLGKIGSLTLHALKTATKLRAAREKRNGEG